MIIVNDFRLQAVISPKWLQILESDDRLACHGMLAFHPYRWNQLKVIPVACIVRTRMYFPMHRFAWFYILNNSPNDIQTFQILFCFFAKRKQNAYRVKSCCLHLWNPHKIRTSTIFTGSIARSASRQYLIYSDADFEVFRCHRWGWNLARRWPLVWRRGPNLERTRGPLARRRGPKVPFGPLLRSSAPNFTPVSATTSVKDSKDWNFYTDLTKMWNINASLARFSQNLQSLYPIPGCFSC